MKTTVRSLSAALILISILAVACGGGSKGSGGSGDTSSGGGLSEKRAGELAKQYVLDVFGIITGDVNPQRLIDSFAPECREGVKASDISAAIGFISIFVPQLADVKIEDVDLGKLTFEKTDKGILVRPVDPNAVRIKVKGKFVNANDFFKDLGFDSVEDTPAIADDAILVVERDGKAYLGTCSELQDFGGSGLQDSNVTPVSSGPVSTSVPGTTTRPASTTVPAASRPGGTRAGAVALGAAATVEDLWRITVVSVNRDAWTVVQKASTFNDPPAANERMVLITVKVENVSKNDDAESISDFEFQLTGSLNKVYSSFSDDNQCGQIDDDLNADLFPGGQARGDICFKVPRDETNLLLIWEAFGPEGKTYLKLD
jgi:hypothetical protein